MPKIKRYTFCHIPKTAGTSIWQLLNYLDIRHKVYSRKNTDLFLFAFVRNPYSRCLSAYEYLKNGGISEIDKHDSKKYIGFSDFEDFVLNTLEFAASQQQHFRPQHYWIPDGANFIGKFETLEKDIGRLRKLIEMKYISIPHLNATSYDKNSDICQNLKDVIYSVYEKDFALFDYPR